MAFDPGDTFDRYRLEALIGEGGMGRVFRAFDPKLRRRVAIKILSLSKRSDERSDVERVFQEARAAAALDHPGVVAVFDVSEADGFPFIVMEFVEGRSLRALIGVEKVPIRERVRWMKDIARALGAAHRVGLVHRDIKPENVMIRDDGAVKLVDFGIARRLDNDESNAEPGQSRGKKIGESSVAGTPSYMAPEQVQRRPIDGRVDQFAWGVMAYELLTGELPWQMIKRGIPTSVAVVTEKPKPLPTETLGLSAFIGVVVMRALEKSAARRFESMHALLDALEEGESDRTLLVLPDSTKAGANETAQDTQEGTHTEVNAPVRVSSRSRETVTRRRFSPRSTWIAVAILGVLGAGFVALRNLENDSPALVVTQATVSAAPEIAVSANAWKPSAEALAAYAEGNRRLRNAALAEAMERFDEAIEYEPGYAAAYLRLAITRLVDGPHPSGAEEFLAATRLRRRLGALDAAILDAFAPSFEHEPPQLEVTAERLADVEKRFAGDVDSLLFRPEILVAAGRDDEAAALLREYAGRFPKAATSHLGLAYIHGRYDKLEEARDALEKCLELAPDAVDCIWYEGKLDAYMGRCKAMEADALRWQKIKKNDQSAIYAQIQAMIAQQAPAAAIDGVLKEAASRMSIASHARTTRILKTSRFILEGRFDEADRILKELPNQAELDNSMYLWVNELRVEVHEELGDVETAAKIAQSMLARKGNLPQAGDLHIEAVEDDNSMFFLRVLLGAGVIQNTEFEARRNKWLEAWRKRGAIHNERELWMQAYAVPTRTAEGARKALELLKPLGQPRRFVTGRLLVVDVARVYQLAGRLDEASKLLEEACNSCLAAGEPFRFIQAHVLLGQVREAQGQNEAACKAYHVVLEHWGKARPKSKTADQVREASRILKCK